MLRRSERTSARRRASFLRRRFAAAVLAAGLVAVVHGAAVRATPSHIGGSTVVVQAGDTLWSIGRRHVAAGTDLRRWVFEVQHLNGLHAGAVTAGQTLRLPG